MGLAGMAAQAAGPLHVGYGGASELSNDKAAGPRPQPLGANLPGYAIIPEGGDVCLGPSTRQAGSRP